MGRSIRRPSRCWIRRPRQLCPMRRRTPRPRCSRTSIIGQIMAPRSSSASTSGCSDERLSGARRMAAIATTERPPASSKPWTPARGYALLLIAPALVLAIFFIWPLVQVVVRSFIEPEIGFGNYARIFETSTYLRVIINTMMLAGTVAVATLILGYPVAWMVSGARGSILYVCLALILIPFWTSVVIRTFAWLVLFQRRGILNSILLSSGLIDQPLRLMHNSIGVHIGMVHILLPFMILPLLSTMRGIDPTI